MALRCFFNQTCLTLAVSSFCILLLGARSFTDWRQMIIHVVLSSLPPLSFSQGFRAPAVPTAWESQRKLDFQGAQSFQFREVCLSSSDSRDSSSCLFFWGGRFGFLRVGWLGASFPPALVLGPGGTPGPLPSTRKRRRRVWRSALLGVKSPLPACGRRA